jgi:hypothetical protein
MIHVDDNRAAMAEPRSKTAAAVVIEPHSWIPFARRLGHYLQMLASA